MNRIQTKFQHMITAFTIYLEHPEGVTDAGLAQQLSCDRATAFRLRQEFGSLMHKVSHGHFTIKPDAQLLHLAKLIQRSQ